MIDTVDIIYKFSNLEQYNHCYKVIDEISDILSKGKNRIHKKSNLNYYVTTFFKPIGFSEIAFFKCKKYNHFFIKIVLKPIRLIYPNSHIRLARYEDYDEIERRFNVFIRIINEKIQEILLPNFSHWKVGRIDYTINVQTSCVQEYLRLFYKGYVPKGFSFPKVYSDSFYLISSECRINFYDKLLQLKQKQNLTDDDIEQLRIFSEMGILRLEVQCLNKKVLRLKDEYSLPDSCIKYFWNKKIAEDVICRTILRIIGKADFFSFETCKVKLQQTYGIRTVNRCIFLIHTLIKNSNWNLNDLKRYCKKYSDFNQLVFKIRAMGTNVIALDVLSDCNKDFLVNPIKFISF